MQNPLNQQSKSLSAADILLSLVAKVAEQTAHSVIVTDAKHCIVWVNEGFSQLRGHSLDFAKGKTPGSLLASELSDKAVLAQIAQAVANQQALRCELQSHDRCGNAIWLDIEIRPIFNTAGKLEGFSQFETNITALVTAKQDLVKERARLDELAEGIEAGLGQWDITNDTVTFNNRLTSMLGDPKGSWINAEGIKWRARCHPDDVDHLSEIFQRICSGKESQISTELRLKHANQNWLSMMVRAHVTERLPNGEPKGISGIYIDVTEKREQDRKLHEAKEAAEAANQAKSSFLATMSHEIRTPMNGVLGMAEMLSTSPLSEDQSESVGIIRQSASSLLALIDDILDFSKIDASRVEMDERAVAVSEIVFGVIDSLLPVALARSVKLRAYVDPSLPERILIDDTRLRQVLNNLIGNAIKFSSGEMARRGSVYVRVVTRDQKTLTISVADNGIGIDQSNIDKVFDVFNQAERTTTRRFGGTGLGLAISKRLVNLMGGAISVESLPGEGSVFMVQLPLKADVDSKAKKLTLLNDHHCVVVSNNATESFDLTTSFRHHGAHVYKARDLNQARSQVQAIGRPTIVIHSQAIGSEKHYSAALHSLNWPADVYHLLLSDGARKSLRMIDETIACIDWSNPAVLCKAAALMSSGNQHAVMLAKGNKSIAGSVQHRKVEQRQLSPHLKILVAEDDAINQKVISRQLLYLGVNADVVETGQQALERWIADPSYSILLTDLHMPDMDGYQLAREIRSREVGNNHLPILALTANAVSGETFEAYKAGIDLYLTKPILLEDLYAAISTFALDPIHRTIDSELALQPYDALVIEAALEHNEIPDFDPHRLQAIVGDDEEALVELMDAYQEDAVTLVDALAQSLRHRIAVERRSIAHRLKSASRSVGALWLGELCERSERLGDLHSQDEADSLAIQIQNAYLDFQEKLVHAKQSLNEKVGHE